MKQINLFGSEFDPNKEEKKAKDIKRLLLQVYKKYQRGEITDATAYKETYILNTILKAIEVTELEQRLQQIETKLRRDE
jgi:hypothetical protein